MKNKIICILAVFLIVNINIKAQEPINIFVKENFTLGIGGRVVIDGAHYINDKTDMSSGVKITQLRFKLLGTFFKNFEYKFDADFATLDAPIKDAFLRWNFKEIHSIRVGYYVLGFSLDRVTSLMMHPFIARPATSVALTLSRKMGLSYRLNSKYIWTDIGVFAGDPFKTFTGDDGIGVSNRTAFRTNLFKDKYTLHLGFGLSYRTPEANGFKDGNDDDNRYFEYASNNEANIDQTKIIDAKIENARSEFKFNSELLFMGNKYFITSEYTGALISRARNNQKLFKEQLGGIWSFQTLEAWEKWYGKNLRDIYLSGVIAQFGFIIFGKGNYEYNQFEAYRNVNFIKGTLEFVGRFNYTNLNDIDGLWYNGKFYDPAKGVGVDPPNFNYSIAGGELYSVTVGLNYYINTHMRIMVNYGYQSINNLNLLDKFSHSIQGRLVFYF